MKNRLGISNLDQGHTNKQSVFLPDYNIKYPKDWLRVLPGPGFGGIITKKHKKLKTALAFPSGA